MVVVVVEGGVEEAVVVVMIIIINDNVLDEMMIYSFIALRTKYILQRLYRLNWCNTVRGMCYRAFGMVHIKDSLMLNKIFPSFLGHMSVTGIVLRSTAH